jgi:hypothetical protein
MCISKPTATVDGNIKENLNKLFDLTKGVVEIPP